MLVKVGMRKVAEVAKYAKQKGLEGRVLVFVHLHISGCSLRRYLV